MTTNVKKQGRIVFEAAVLLFAACTSGCGIHTYPNIQARALSAGDKDYPALNPHAAHVIEFSAIIPPSISPRFYVQYSVSYSTIRNKDGSLLRYESPLGCRWKQTDQFYVVLPLATVKLGNTYRGGFAIDRFHPGKCGWTFSEILSPMLRAPLAWYRDYTSGPGDQLARRVDIWCTKHTNIHPYIDLARRNDLNEVNNCASLSLVSGVFINLPPGFLASVPEAERQDGRPGVIGRHTQALTVEFHDLDELVRASPKTP